MRNLWTGVLLFPLCVLSGQASIIAVTGQAVVVPISMLIVESHQYGGTGYFT
jgi:hypothetical protein